jgi:inhibitor of KinA
MKLEPLGDSAVVATLEGQVDAALLARVTGLARAIGASAARGIMDVVPAYSSVTVFYDPLHVAEPGDDAYARVCGVIESCAAQAAAGPEPEGRLVEIPVCYGGLHGPDLDHVAAQCGLTQAEVVALHWGASYLVHAIGFTPGFPYLGGLPAQLSTPRRERPREKVAPGSVGIGGSQTGVYPLASPGGWQIIGCTPLALFDARREHAALLAPGDRVLFKPITQAQFESWK